MSLTLGEKLRQAREERGITLSEVAEQTRISSLYLESIDNDDYRTLPGGIFNRGFVKSYAKYVGLDEQEALAEYSQILAQSESAEEDHLKHYKPEVLTDDRSGSSMLPTIIVALVILALMTAGVLYGVSYLRQPSDPTVANKKSTSNVNTNSAPTANANTTVTNASAPDMATLKIEFKALTQPVRLSATTDGTKTDNVVAAGSTATFEPKESLTLNYNRWNAQAVQLSINGKSIALPSTPLNPKDKRIEFTITKDNIAQIWTSGAISTEVPAANVDANANVAPANGTAAPPSSKPTPVSKPSTPANTDPTPKSTVTPKPAPTPKPTQRPVVIVRSANRPN
jgi:cytoskeleton protein RodZ